MREQGERRKKQMGKEQGKERKEVKLGRRAESLRGRDLTFTCCVFRFTGLLLSTGGKSVTGLARISL